jgi:hypothetical protein
MKTPKPMSGKAIHTAPSWCNCAVPKNASSTDNAMPMRICERLARWIGAANASRLPTAIPPKISTGMSNVNASE